MSRRSFWFGPAESLEQAKERRRLARIYKHRIYYGLLCEKHPKDWGARYVSNNKCRTCKVVEENRRRQRERLAAEKRLARLEQYLIMRAAGMVPSWKVAGDPDLAR